MATAFWRRDPHAPYATFLATIETYLHPESEDLPLLRRAVRRTDLEEMRVFNEELRQVVRDPSVLPEGPLFLAAAYEDGSDRRFLDNLWRELYGDEPADG